MNQKQQSIKWYSKGPIVILHKMLFEFVDKLLAITVVQRAQLWISEHIVDVTK